jgi:8-oxo-dGTP pyrophosphatase MutT (NUDIX family)
MVKKLSPLVDLKGINQSMNTVWGPAWKSYIPQNRRVYGCICIADSKKVLLVKGKKGEKKWSFPKGHRELCDTSPLDCALRELKEETGLSLTESFSGSKRFRAGEYYIFLLPEEYEVLPGDSNEIEDAKWFTMEEMQNLNKNVDVSIFTRYVRDPVALIAV